MAGTKAGGRAAAATNKARYGDDFYRNLGKIGGAKTGIVKGFGLNPDRARLAGGIGGTISRRNGNYDMTPLNTAKIQHKRAELTKALGSPTNLPQQPTIPYTPNKTSKIVQWLGFGK